MQRFGIWCSVQGSLGYREAWLKSDATRVEFNSYEEALTRASSLNKEKMKNPYAIFYYCPRLIRGEQ